MLDYTLKDVVASMCQVSDTHYNEEDAATMPHVNKVIRYCGVMI